jgi:hypothetical protein
MEENGTIEPLEHHIRSASDDVVFALFMPFPPFVNAIGLLICPLVVQLKACANN